MTLVDIKREYEKLKRMARLDNASRDVAAQLARIADQTISYLETIERIELESKVAGKEYFAFKAQIPGKSMSRAVNAVLYRSESIAYLGTFLDNPVGDLSHSDRSQLLYTMAASFFCTLDVLSQGDQKTPATYFELLIGHLLSRAFGVNPSLAVAIPDLISETTSVLPTDFIFDLGTGKPKFHVPVKTSTRERAIQVFAHQRVLDGMHGSGTFRGLLIGFAETKLNHGNREVVEICLPEQWVVYQKYIAAISRFYYFDVPEKYAALNDGHPPMAVKDFAAFFDEVSNLVSSRH